MTTIKLLANDQHLTVTEKPKVASGDVESVKLKVEFDALWGNYTARSAVFYTANNPTVYEALLMDDECVIPHEVLSEPGTLCIGVRGLKADGTAIKTSTVVKYKIAEGASSPAESTKEPSPDMYQQLLASIDSKLDPFRSDFEHTLDVKFAEQSRTVNDAMNSAVSNVETKINDEVYAIMAGDVVWTNPDATVAFPAQTIELDLTEYKRFDIIFKTSTDGDAYYQHSCNRKNVTYNYYSYMSTSAITYRSALISDSGVDFAEASAGTVSNKNKYMIPVEIIGYKF